MRRDGLLRLWITTTLVAIATLHPGAYAYADADADAAPGLDPVQSFWIHRAFPIDPTQSDLPQPADIRIEKGKIAEIRAVDPDGLIQTHLPVIDADGRFLVPGFIDTHAHVALGPVQVESGEGAPRLKIATDDQVTHRSLLSLLAHGITTIRDPGGDTQTLVTLRDRLERFELVGPRLRVAGAVIDRQPFEGLSVAVEGPEEVRAAVRRQAEAGVDWIKLYTQLSRDELKAGIDEAHAHHLPAVAHLQQISWTEAAELGLDAIVHGVPGSPHLLPEASREAYRPDMLGTRFLYSWFEHVDFESPAIQEMLKVMKARDVTLDLTLVAFEAMVRGDDPARTREQRGLRWVAESLVENWRTFFTFNIGWEPRDFERARNAWPRVLEFARRLHDSGLRITIGTDANNPWTVAGPSFHRELELLAEAGIPTHDLLVMATTNGAQALGLDEETGSLRVGFAADLVLLERNPLDDISATREVTWILRGGRLHTPENLLADLDESP